MSCHRPAALRFSPPAWKSRNEQTFTQRKSTKPVFANMSTGRRTNAKSNSAYAGSRIQEIKEANTHISRWKKKKTRVMWSKQRTWKALSSSKGWIRAVVSHAGLGSELEMLLVLRRRSTSSEVKLPLFYKKGIKNRLIFFKGFLSVSKKCKMIHVFPVVTLQTTSI